jgi:HlyD family secretion protein
MKRAIGVSLLLVLLVVAGVVGGGVGAFVYSQWFAPSDPKPVKSQGELLGDLDSFSAVRSPNRGPFVAALGRLEPRGNVIDVAGGTMGARLGSLEVKVGQYVMEGTILGHLDAYHEARAQRNAAAAQLDEAKTRLKAELAYNDALIEQARIGVQEAKELDPLDIQAQEAQVNLRESVFATDSKERDRMRSVTTGIPLRTLEQQDLLVRRDEQELKAAQSLLAKAKAGAHLKLQSALAQLEAARAAKERLKASTPIDSLEKNLELAKVQVDRTIIKAPRDGRILQVLTHPGESTDRMPILKMGDTNAMYVVAEIYETDILDVEVGQTATITSRALNSELTGRVDRIGKMVFKNDVLHVDPAADSDARVVEVWILLDSTDETVASMTNLQVDVKIKRTVKAGTYSAGESTQPGERKASQ